jgi:hypothetical protein
METFGIVVASIVGVGGLAWTIYQAIHRRNALTVDLNVLKMLTELGRTDNAKLVGKRVEKLVQREYGRRPGFPYLEVVHLLFQIANTGWLGLFLVVKGLELYINFPDWRTWTVAGVILVVLAMICFVGWIGIGAFGEVATWWRKRQGS